MTIGYWCAGFPCLTLTLLGGREPISLEFVVETGFNGEVALRDSLIGRLGASPKRAHYLELAGGFRQLSYSYELLLEKVLALDGNPLIGNELWKDQSLQAENMEGGDVFFEPL